jgi:peptidoglycan hydrolase-like protein with peptidoglycan-binding domain
VWPQFKTWQQLRAKGALFFTIEPFLAEEAPTRPLQPAPLRRVELRQGDRSEAVKEAQALLNAAGASPTLTPDGAFGPRTKAAVSLYQKNIGLPVSGCIDKATWASLENV